MTRLAWSAMLALALSAALHPARASEERLDSDTAGRAKSLHPQIVAAGSTLYTVWQDHRSGRPDIYFNRSLDGGDSWLASDVRLDSDPGNHASLDPALAASGSKVYVAWDDDRDGKRDIYFNRSLDSGATWLASDVRLDTSSPAGSKNSLDVAIAAEGDDVWVLWFDSRNGWEDIYLNRSTDAGSTWLGDVRIDLGDTPGSAGSYHPRLAVAGGHVHVVWHDFRNGSYDIYYNRSLDGGATWLAAAVRLDSGDAAGSSDSLHPELSVVGSTVNVVWDDFRNGRRDILSNRSIDSGSTWAPAAVRLDGGDPAGAATSMLPSIASVGSTVLVAWEEGRNNLSDVYLNRSIDGGATWLATPVRLDTGSAPGSAASLDPVLALEGSFAAVTWWDGRNGQHDIFLNHSLDGGATWQAAGSRLDQSLAGESYSFGPSLAVAGTEAYVVWQDRRDGSFDIYYASYDAP